MSGRTDHASYLAAAKLVDSRKDYFFSCHAVAMQEGYVYPHTFLFQRYPMTVRYADRFRPDDLDLEDVWFSGFRADSEIKEMRVLMLCFMAAMVEAGDA